MGEDSASAYDGLIYGLDYTGYKSSIFTPAGLLLSAGGGYGDAELRFQAPVPIPGDKQWQYPEKEEREHLEPECRQRNSNEQKQGWATSVWVVSSSSDRCNSGKGIHS